MRVGDRVGGRFELEAAAAAGGMGKVFRARDLTTNARVALKTVDAVEDVDAQRFLREASVLRELAHPSVVRYVAHGTTDDGFFLAMEWLEGEDLAKRLARAPLTFSEALVMATRVAEALGAAHARGIVHRDVKPGNIWLEGRDPTRAKLIDFGIAHLGEGALTQTGITIGTPAYMAPEQARGLRDVGPAADVFSLGSVLFRCVTGRPAFAGEHMVAVLAKILFDPSPHLREAMDGVPAELDALVARMLAKDPAERPRDGAALALELSRVELDVSPPSIAPATRRNTSLTDRELRLVAFVIARRTRALTDDVRARLEKNGGRFERLVDGSGVVVLEGAGPATDQAGRAARCALALHEAMPDVPIALAMDAVEVGPNPPVQSVIDRAASLVGRDHAAGTGVIVDPSTAGLLDARFEIARQDGAQWLRGERDAPLPARTLLGRATPCVGRERELAAIDGIVAESFAEGAPRVVLVVGAPGVGKSRLAREAVASAQARAPGLQVWIARADPVWAGAPFTLLAPMLRREADVLQNEPVEVRREKLTRRLGRHVPETERARVTAFIGEMLGTPFPDEAIPKLRAARLTPHVLGDQMRSAWTDLVAAETSAAPLMLVLEDVHWGDRPSLDFIDAALLVVGDRPWIVLALARPEIDERYRDLFAHRELARVDLRELSRRASERLATEVLGEVARGTLDRVVTLAAGNAFYLEELIRAVAEGREELPETVRAMVQSRLDDLDADARRALRAASIVGEVFWRGAVSALLGGARLADVDRWLADLTRRELISPSGPARFEGETQYAFRHAVVRDAAYATLVDRDRPLGHELAARWLIGVGEQEAFVVANHLEQAGLADEAVEWHVRAAEQSLGANDFPGAIARAERAIACGARGIPLGTSRLIQAEASWWNADIAGTERFASEAVGCFEPGTDRWFEASSLVGRVVGTRGDAGGLRALSETVAGHLHEGASRIALIAGAQLAQYLVHVAERDAARPLLERVASLARSTIAADALLRGWITRAWMALAMHDAVPFAYLEHGIASHLAFVEAGDVRNGSVATANLAYAYTVIGRHVLAEQLLRDTLALCERAGMTRAISTNQHLLAILLYRRGRFVESSEYARAALEGFRLVGDQRMEAGALLVLAALRAKTGDPSGAERELEEALRTMPQRGLPWRVYALALVAELCLERGDVAAALVRARPAIEAVETAGVEAEIFVRMIWVRTLEASGEPERARAELTTAVEKLHRWASYIRSEEDRRTFLEIDEHRRTLDLARAWGLPVQRG